MLTLSPAVASVVLFALSLHSSGFHAPKIRQIFGIVKKLKNKIRSLLLGKVRSATQWDALLSGAGNYTLLIRPKQGLRVQLPLPKSLLR